MRRFKILKTGMSDGEVGSVKALAAGAGFAASEIEVVDEVGEPDNTCDDEILLILASPALCAGPELEAALVAVQQGARRAICMWPDGADPVDPPAAALKYAYSIISFDVAKLRAASADDDELCFEKADGTPLPKPETERNLCVDEKAPAA